MRPVQRNEHGYIVNADELSCAEVVGEKSSAPLAIVRESTGPLAGMNMRQICSGVPPPEETARKQEFKTRFRHLFRPD